MQDAAPADDDDLLLTAEVPAEMDGRRLDVACARLFDDYSRARLQNWIVQGRLRLNDAVIDKARHPVSAGDRIELQAEPEVDQTVAPQDIPLEVVYQDRAIAVINKPAGLTVHPGAGQRDRTLQNALLHRFAQTAQVPRAGIVHRLDKDTSGLLIVALTLPAHARLVAMLERRDMRREYDAIVHGALIAGGTVDAPIDRHPRDRVRMAVVDDGREAVTHYRVQERFAQHTHLRVRLETGRTHQIRVHLAHIRHPLVGDTLYGGGGVRGAGLSESLRTLLREFPRQALHARELTLSHPIGGQAMEWAVDMPADMLSLLDALRRERPGR